MKLRFYVNTWIFGRCPIEQVLDRVAALGYDGVELAGEPNELPAEKVSPMLRDRGLAVASICGLFPGPEPGDIRYLGHSDPKERRNAVDYVRACIDMARALGSAGVVVAPAQVGNPSYYASSKEEDWKHAVESLNKAGEYAQANQVYLTIEPINRYEVGLVNSLDDALQMARQAASPYVRVMADTFHMQIEEPDGIPNAIRRAGDWLRHFHAADNTRDVPGMGTMPWKDILRALHDIGYVGGVSLEPLPRGASPYDARDGVIPAETLDRALGKGLTFLRMIDDLVDST